MTERKIVKREGTMASVRVLVSVGSSNEEEKEYGMAHFMEHMMFKGNKKRSELEQSELIDANGLDINAFTSKGRTEYYISGIAEKLTVMLEILSDMLRYPALSEEGIEREKGVVCEEIVMDNDNNNAFFHTLVRETRYQGSNYSHPVLGYKETVSAFTRDMCVNFFNKHYDLGNMSVIVIAPEEYIDDVMIYNAFPEPVNPIITETEYATHCIGTLNVERDIEGEEIVIYAGGVGGAHKDASPLSMAMMALGYGMGSRLFKDLRVTQSLCYSVYACHSSYRNSGDCMIWISTTPEKAEQSITSIKNHLKDLAENGITTDELSKVKMQMRVYLASKFETADGTGMETVDDLFGSGRMRTYEQMVADIEAVTLEDISRVVKHLGNEDKYLICRMAKHYEWIDRKVEQDMSDMSIGVAAGV